MCVCIESNLDDDEIHDHENEVPKLHVDMKNFKWKLIEENNKEVGVEEEYMSNDSFSASSSEGKYFANTEQVKKLIKDAIESRREIGFVTNNANKQGRLNRLEGLRQTKVWGPFWNFKFAIRNLPTLSTTEDQH
ncbi:hypothetical protein QVD17_16376 [Tagetes erecta]|uniref:Uncharacterized protein n=1 Tax=Tagetes erecta TaxID=13708 RepID=A0AAD8P0M3_TARER|nr:hypothetical protein QVD17_16376 [Tagetes erecta]